MPFIERNERKYFCSVLNLTIICVNISHEIFGNSKISELARVPLLLIIDWQYVFCYLCLWNIQTNGSRCYICNDFFFWFCFSLEPLSLEPWFNIEISPYLLSQPQCVKDVIIFLYVQFCLWLASVSYRGKKVRTVASPAVRLVNKSLGTWSCAQNKPEYAICVFFTTHLYYKAPGLILCDLIWQICHNYNRLDDGHCDVTGHRKMSALGTAGALVTPMEMP